MPTPLHLPNIKDEYQVQLLERHTFAAIWRLFFDQASSFGLSKLRIVRSRFGIFAAAVVFLYTGASGEVRNSLYLPQSLFHFSFASSNEPFSQPSMWYLKEEATREKPCAPIPYWLGGVEGGGRTIGRKNVDIRLKASSVSRTHATIRVQKSSFHRASHGTVPTVEDSSAYGTFLKYPQGHAANRASQRDGHHDRLNKETPVEICEGALLAFGAPSPWWRVGWKSILVLPHKLDERQSTRLEEVVSCAGLAVAKPNSKDFADITHVVTSVCRTSSGTFLRAVIEGKRIVTPGWTNALETMVSGSCKQVFTSGNDEEALTATAIPDEEAYRPPYSEEDISTYGKAAITVAHDRSRDRSKIFSSIVFYFAAEDRFGRWNSVLRSCGATCTVGSTSLHEGRRIVHVTAAPPDGDDSPGMQPFCTETDVVRAILTADAGPIQEASRGTPAVAAPAIADVATPAPSDSDAETADNDPVETVHANSTGLKAGRRKRPRRPSGSVESADDDGDGHSGRLVSSDAVFSGDREGCGQKAAGSNPDGPSTETDRCAGSKKVLDQAGGSNGGPGDVAGRSYEGDEVDDDVNQVVFFDLPHEANGRSAFESPEDKTNVKTFKKQQVPGADSGGQLALERVREAELELTPRASSSFRNDESEGINKGDEDVEEPRVRRGEMHKQRKRSRGAVVENCEDGNSEDERGASAAVSSKRRRRR